MTLDTAGNFGLDTCNTFFARAHPEETLELLNTRGISPIIHHRSEKRSRPNVAQALSR